MGDDNTNQKKRKAKWTTSYSNMSLLDAEKRLGFMMETLGSGVIPVERMLAKTQRGFEGPGADAMLNIKEKVFDAIVQYLEMEGYPTESNADFNETNVSDLVLYTIGPILSGVRRHTGRNIRLRREKEIVSTDSETGGKQEFVFMDLISVMERNFVLVIEAKRSSLGEAMKQCLLSMKDMRDNNGGGKVYGFVTFGESWRMISYDGTFQMTEKMDVTFDTMEQDKKRWIKDYSVLVDCMYAALANGGIVENLFLRSSRSNTDPLIYTDTMGDDNTNQKKRKSKWTTSYSKMTIPEAEKRLGFWIDELRAVTVDTMLVNAKHSLKVTDAIKEKVYDRIVECLANEGYPTEASADFKEANVSDFVYATIGPILFDFGQKTERKRLRLAREKEIISTDNETGGAEEFVVMDRISVGQERFVVVIMEAKRSSLGEGMKQCLLAMKDARDNNGGGEVYGFVITGDTWRMLKYDGKFQMTEKMDVIFDTMDENKERWMKVPV